MLRICSNNHLTGYRRCSVCGSSNSTPFVGQPAPKTTHGRGPKPPITNRPYARSKRAAAQHRGIR